MAKELLTDEIISEIVEKIAQQVSPALAQRLGLDYHCTGTRFGCGEYSCISSTHSCKGDFDCHGKFSNSYFLPTYMSR